MNKIQSTMVLLVLCAGAAQAQVFAHNTFQPGDVGPSGSWTGGVNSVFNSNYFVGFRFTASATGELSRVRMPLIGQSFPPSPEFVQFEIYSYGPGDTLGTQLATSSQVLLGGTMLVREGVFTNGPTLTAGQKYWVGFRPTGFAKFGLTTPPSQDRTAFRSTADPSLLFYTNNAQAAMQVEVVPEPATLSALGLGLAALMRRRVTARKSNA